MKKSDMNAPMMTAVYANSFDTLMLASYEAVLRERPDIALRTIVDKSVEEVVTAMGKAIAVVHLISYALIYPDHAQKLLEISEHQSREDMVIQADDLKGIFSRALVAAQSTAEVYSVTYGLE